jgi:hypothetical protein
MEPDIQQTRHRDRDCSFVTDNIGAFVLDALDRVERGIVEHHLRWCESCRVEAARFDHVLETMHLATPPGPAPSPETKAALFQRIEVETSSDGRLPQAETTVEANRESPSKPEPANRWRYASAALIAPLALALLVMGVWANSLRTDLDERNVELESQVLLNDALSNGGQVELYSVQQSCPTCTGDGQLGVSESNAMGMLVGWNFDPSQQHDVWGVDSNGDRKKVCQLHVESSGAVMQMFTFPETPSVFTDVYITDENGDLIYVSHLGNTGEEDPGTAAPGIPTT